MADQKSQIPVHPMIANLTKGGAQPPEATIRFAGYVGPPSQVGLVRIYSTLSDLSHYVEFDEGAVVQTAQAPDSLIPDSGLCVWVKASTPVRWVREYQKASDLAAAIENSLSQSSGSGSTSSASVQ